MAIGEETMTLSKMDGNLQVNPHRRSLLLKERRPWVVAVDGIVFPLGPKFDISFRTLKHVCSESYKKLYSSKLRNDFGWSMLNDVKALEDTVQGLRERQRSESMEAQFSTSDFLVPYQRNENFTGRQKLMDALRIKLCEVAPKQWNHRVALYGLAGIGKTQIALEYVYAQQANYKQLFWINGFDEATFFSGFQEIAKWTSCVSEYRNLKPAQTAERVLHWLNQREDWLLVIDNLDDMNVIAGRLPYASPKRHTLITTRHSHCHHIPAQGLEVGVLDTNDAIDLLLLRSKGERGSPTEKETAECAEVVAELGYLPLAIEQAAAFIREGSKDLYMFLPSYRKNRQFYHSRVSEGNLHYYRQSITTTWRLCLQALEKTNSDAINLVKLLSFLNHDGILVDFLDAGKDALSADLRVIIVNKIRFYEAVAALEKFSLIRRQGSGSDGERLTIHRLVQSVIKDEMSQELLSTMGECVIRLCDVAFPPWHNWDHALLLQSRRYVGQVLLPLLIIHQPQSNAFVDLLLRVGIFLREEGKYQEASELVEKALEVLNRTRGTDHPETLTAMADLASTYWNQGRWNAAEKLQETVLEARTRVLGTDHPDTAIAMASLASTYRSQGRWDEAVKLQ
jgi:tetratricopeptide (TPR) repeat protein